MIVGSVATVKVNQVLKIARDYRDAWFLKSGVAARYTRKSAHEYDVDEQGQVLRDMSAGVRAFDRAVIDIGDLSTCLTYLNAPRMSMLQGRGSS